MIESLIVYVELHRHIDSEVIDEMRQMYRDGIIWSDPDQDIVQAVKEYTAVGLQECADTVGLPGPFRCVGAKLPSPAG